MELPELFRTARGNYEEAATQAREIAHRIEAQLRDEAAEFSARRAAVNDTIALLSAFIESDGQMNLNPKLTVQEARGLLAGWRELLSGSGPTEQELRIRR